MPPEMGILMKVHKHTQRAEMKINEVMRVKIQVQSILSDFLGSGVTLQNCWGLWFIKQLLCVGCCSEQSGSSRKQT